MSIIEKIKQLVIKDCKGLVDIVSRKLKEMEAERKYAQGIEEHYKKLYIKKKIETKYEQKLDNYRNSLKDEPKSNKLDKLKSMVEPPIINIRPPAFSSGFSALESNVKKKKLKDNFLSDREYWF